MQKKNKKDPMLGRILNKLEKELKAEMRMMKITQLL